MRAYRQQSMQQQGLNTQVRRYGKMMARGLMMVIPSLITVASAVLVLPIYLLTQLKKKEPKCNKK